MKLAAPMFVQLKLERKVVLENGFEPDRSYNLGFMIPDSSFSLSENNVPEIVIYLNQQTNCLADSIRMFEEALDDFYRINAPFFCSTTFTGKRIGKV